MPRSTPRTRAIDEINAVTTLIDIEFILAAVQDRRRAILGENLVEIDDADDDDELDEDYNLAFSEDSTESEHSVGSQLSGNGDDDDDYLVLHDPILHHSYHLGPLDDLVIEEDCNCDDFNNNIGQCLRDHRSNNWLSIDFDLELNLASEHLNDVDREKNNLQRKRLYVQVWENLDPRFINHAEGDDYGYARVKLPACAYSLIRMIWPSSTGRYMGFRQS